MNIQSTFLSRLSPRQLGYKKFGAILAIVILAGAGSLFWFQQSSSSKKMGAELAHTEGTVQYKETDGGPWQKASVDLPVKPGMSVRVSGEGRAVINLDDGSAIRLNSDSTAQLAILTYKHVLIENDGGQIYTRVTKSATRIFEVKTSKSTYRSMGTAYRTIDTPEKEGVEVYHSKVNILGVTQNGVIVEQGERYYQMDKTNPDQTSKVTEIDRDAILTDSFISWNSDEDRKEFKSELGVLFDIKPPALEVSSPANGLSTAAAIVVVKGTTESGARILVNGIDAANTAGSFGLQVNLVVGPNSLKVEAADGAGNKTVKTISITRTAPAAPPAVAAKVFSLYGTKVDKGVSLSWSVSGYDVSKGFKLIRGSTANPTYDGKVDKVFLESVTRSYTWKIQDGQTHHFRICTYNGSGCASYSNNVAVTAPAAPVSTSESPSGTVDLTAGSGGAVSWVLNGSAPNGYKLVWSTSSGPVYPGSSAEYQNVGTTGATISDDPGTYYVRICMYKDGTCPIYSNEVQITIP